MSKISEVNYGTDIVRSYNLKSVDNRVKALEWMAQVIITNMIDIHTIEMKDYLSYHDGSQTKPIDRFASINEFVNEYASSVYTGVGISGLFDGIPFDLEINLDTQNVALVLGAKDRLYFEKMESLLELS